MIQDAKAFDSDLQMFCEVPLPVNVARLRFQRWLLDHGRAEHPPAGPPAGELVESLTVFSPMTEARS